MREILRKMDLVLTMQLVKDASKLMGLLPSYQMNHFSITGLRLLFRPDIDGETYLRKREEG